MSAAAVATPPAPPAPPAAGSPPATEAAAPAAPAKKEEKPAAQPSATEEINSFKQFLADFARKQEEKEKAEEKRRAEKAAAKKEEKPVAMETDKKTTPTPPAAAAADAKAQEPVAANSNKRKETEEVDEEKEQARKIVQLDKERRIRKETERMKELDKAIESFELEMDDEAKRGFAPLAGNKKSWKVWTDVLDRLRYAEKAAGVAATKQQAHQPPSRRTTKSEPVPATDAPAPPKEEDLNARLGEILAALGNKTTGMDAEAVKKVLDHQRNHPTKVTHRSQELVQRSRNAPDAPSRVVDQFRPAPVEASAWPTGEAWKNLTKQALAEESKLAGGSGFGRRPV
jgi:hypothetical protein